MSTIFAWLIFLTVQDAWMGQVWITLLGSCANIVASYALLSNIHVANDIWDDVHVIKIMRTPGKYLIGVGLR